MSRTHCSFGKFQSKILRSVDEIATFNKTLMKIHLLSQEGEKSIR